MTIEPTHTPMKYQISPKISEACTYLIVPATPQTLPAATQSVAKFLGNETGFTAQNFKAQKGETMLFTALNEGNFIQIAFLGLGENPQPHNLMQGVRSHIFKQKKNLENANIEVMLTHFSAKKPAVSQFAAGALQGFLLAFYHIGIFKTDAPALSFQGNFSLVTNAKETELVKTACEKAEILAQTQLQVLDLVNTPANHLNAETFADIAKKAGKEHHFGVKVLNEKDLEHEGFGALLAVNKGSKNEPRFVIMDYKPEWAKKSDLKTIAIVGKGVTFDTGGISMKASANMHYMKSDMAGAAVAFGAMLVAARLKLPLHIVAAMPLTDNCVDAKATLPGDVVKSYSGQTIEIIDTDAEGRLILADALSYICQHYKPDTVIDLATLTGACIVALGNVAAGMFSNNNELSKKLSEAGMQTGEKVWAMPLWDDYAVELKSDVADLKNYHGKPSAGSIVAAKFLEKFIHQHTNWAHLDIAGTAFGAHEYSDMPSATAFGVALLAQFMQNEA